MILNDLELNKIYHGNALKVLKTFPDKTINCVVTSPPYWNLRDYEVNGQLGLESTFEEYINNLCNIFDEIKRVLKDTSTIWVNLGDTYASTAQGSFTQGYNTFQPNLMTTKKVMRPNTGNIKSKSLLCIPERFMIEMINRGWILRNKIIWHKKNCMPSSVKDRFTVDFEHILFFSKNKKYYFEQQFETQLESSINRMNYQFGGVLGSAYPSNEKRENPYPPDWKPNPLGRNKRTVWQVNTTGFPGAHFAVFPEELIVIPILAGCPEFICKKCGKPREKIFEPTGNKIKHGGTGSKTADHIMASPTSSLRTKVTQEMKCSGYTDCKCNAGFKSGIVLDPFMGSGTVAKVALNLFRNFIGIELNKEYIEIAEKRIEGLMIQHTINFER